MEPKESRYVFLGILFWNFYKNTEDSKRVRQQDLPVDSQSESFAGFLSCPGGRFPSLRPLVLGLSAAEKQANKSKRQTVNSVAGIRLMVVKTQLELFR